MRGDPPTTYTFGDSDQAIDRLALLAELFAPSTEALLRRWGGRDVGTAIDLGCGPGHTAAAIARICRPRSLVAIDASAAMVDVARRSLRPPAVPGSPPVSVDVRVGDVTETPLPGAPADLLHARYLLAHLPEPMSVVARWAAQLNPGGRLLLDEIERIDTTVAPLARYLRQVTALLAGRGTEMYAGRVLAGAAPAGVEVLADEPRLIPQATDAVARMFAMNLAVWRHDDWIRANVADAELDELAAALDQVACAPPGHDGEVTWTHRQVVYARPS